MSLLPCWRSRISVLSLTFHLLWSWSYKISLLTWHKVSGYCKCSIIPHDEQTRHANRLIAEINYFNFLSVFLHFALPTAKMIRRVDPIKFYLGGNFSQVHICRSHSIKYLFPLSHETFGLRFFSYEMSYG